MFKNKSDLHEKMQRNGDISKSEIENNYVSREWSLSLKI